MAEIENSAPPEPIKDNNKDWTVLNADLISIPELCELFAYQHEGMTYGEACEIVRNKFHNAPSFSIPLYRIKDWGLPFEITGLTVSVLFDIDEHDEDAKAIKVGMRKFIFGMFDTRWWKQEDEYTFDIDWWKREECYIPSILDFNFTAFDVGILKTDAQNFGVTMDDIQQHERAKLAPLTFVGSQAKNPKPDNLHKRKEDSYLEVIAVLFAALGLPHDNMNRADVLLRAHAASQGQDVPSSPTTTSNIFKAALALNPPKKSQ